MHIATRRRRCRYDTSGLWLKGNTHVHSRLSDGGETHDALAARYAGAGYDFLARTDHWIASAAPAASPGDPLIWIDGIEIDGRDATGAAYHVVCLGCFTGIDREAGLIASLARVREQGGLTILAHPLWCGNATADALRWQFDGVEVYNHVCQWINGKGWGASYWHAMLGHNPGTLAFAADDTHLLPAHPGWDGGWIVANASVRSREAIFAAICSGNFYSSTGPSILAMDVAGGILRLETSPVRFMRLVGPSSCGRRLGAQEQDLLTAGEMALPEEWPYVCAEIEDDHGRRAWTNPLFAA